MNAQVAISVVPQHLGGARKLWQLISRAPGRVRSAREIAGTWWECTWGNGKLTIQRHRTGLAGAGPKQRIGMPTVGPPVIECDGISITVDGWLEGQVTGEEALDVAIGIAKCLKAHGLKRRLGWTHVNIEGSPKAVARLKQRISVDIDFPEPHYDSANE